MGRKDMGGMNAGADTVPDVPAGGDPAGGDRIPHNAQHLGNIHATLGMLKSMLEEEDPVLENDHVKAYTAKLSEHLDKHMAEAAKTFAKAYPDLEGLEGGEEEDEGEEKPEKTKAEETETEVEEDDIDKEEEEEDDIEGKTFRSRTRTITHKGKAGKVPGQKRLTKSVHAVCKDASEFLDEHSDHEALDRKTKAACKYHAKALGDVCNKEEVPDEPEPGQMKAEDMMTSEEKSLVAAALHRTAKQIAANKAALEKATGKG